MRSFIRIPLLYSSINYSLTTSKMTCMLRMNSSVTSGYLFCYNCFFSFTLRPRFLFPSLLSLCLCFFLFCWNTFHLNAASLPTHCTWLYITLPFSLRDYHSFSWTLFPFLCSHSSFLFLNWHSLVHAQYILPI